MRLLINVCLSFMAFDYFFFLMEAITKDLIVIFEFFCLKSICQQKHMKLNRCKD